MSIEIVESCNLGFIATVLCQLIAKMTRGMENQFHGFPMVSSDFPWPPGARETCRPQVGPEKRAAKAWVAATEVRQGGDPPVINYIHRE